MANYEDNLTKACVQWYDLQYPDGFIMHIANERNTKRKLPNGKWVTTGEGGKLKEMGVRPGVADLFIPVPCGEYPGLWIELKIDMSRFGKQKKYPTPDQRKFLCKMHKNGYAVAVAWDLDEFRQYVQDYKAGDLVECAYLIDNNHIEV